MTRRTTLLALGALLLATGVLMVGAVAIPDALARVLRTGFAHASLRNLVVGGALVAAAIVVLNRRRTAGREPHVLTTAVDGTPWPASVAVLAATAAACWYALGRGASVPKVFGDELIYMSEARRIALGHAPDNFGYGVVVPMLDSLAFLVTPNDVSAYRLIQTVNAIVASAAAFLVYPLAVRTLSHRLALFAAGVSVVLPWLVYTRFVMTDAVFYPILLLFVLALVRALERPTRSRQVGLAGVFALAFATRAQAVVLIPAVAGAVVAHGLAERDLRETLRAFLPTWMIFGAGMILGAGLMVVSGVKPLGAYEVLVHGWWHPRGLLLWASVTLTSFAVGLGVLVAGAAVFGVAALLRRGCGRSEHAVAAAAVAVVLALLLSVVVLSVSAYGQGAVHERNLFYVAPLFVICALSWSTRGFPRPPRLTAAIVLSLIGLTVVMPTGPLEGSSIDGLSFRPWTQSDGSILTPARAIVAAMVIGALLLIRLNAMWPLILTLALATVGVAAASDFRSGVPRDLAPTYRWVDRVVPPGSETMLLWIGSEKDSCANDSDERALGSVARYSEFFNSRISGVSHLFSDNGTRGVASRRATVTANAQIWIGGRPLRPDFVVADARVPFVGRQVARLKASAVGAETTRDRELALWRVDPPLRIAIPVAKLNAMTSSCQSPK